MNEDQHSFALANARRDPPAITAISEFEAEGEARNSSLNLNDILFILFRHKWKVFLCAAAGILGAAGIYFFLPSPYESRAKLLVRYVVDRSAIDGLDSQGKNLGSQSGNAINSPSENAINSEVEILTSADLAMQVAATIGADRLMGGSGDKVTNTDAARGILKALEVNVVKDSNIISVSYRNQDSKLAMEVLQELVKRYFDKHLEVHRSLGAFDFVTREANRLRAQLNQTEEELKQLKAKAGITSLAEDTATLATELGKVREDRDATEAELAAQKDRVKEIEKLVAGVDAQQSENVGPPPNSAVVGDYQALVGRAAHLQEVKTELLSRYTAQNPIVKVIQAQIDGLEQERRNSESKYPGLLGTFSAAGFAQSSRPDIVSERARLTELATKSETLKARFSTLQARANVLSEMGPKIAQLERKKELEETNYKYYGASLEKARIDETLDPSRMPNISIVQAPSAPAKATRDLKKVVLGLAGGGLATGLAFALLIELVLDRTIKRPLELERRLRIPLFLVIPHFGSNGHRLRLLDAGDDREPAREESEGESAVPESTGELLKPFCEAIRDRLGIYFEMNRMTHKPKLVAVAGLSKNAGASTLAAGLATSLSEASDGKVLLVDKPVVPKRFYDMLLQFKASDLDYVIFDMPSLGDTSSTLPMAGFMDKVLLVVEAEKSNRNAVKRAYAQLAEKTNVSVVFNKSRSYGPKWLADEF